MYGIFGRLLEKLCGCRLVTCGGGDGDAGADGGGVPFEAALLGIGGVKLCGTPTYRMPRHPTYKDMFSNPMYKPIWFKAFGLSCFTRLVSRRAGGFLVTAEPVLQHTTDDLEETIAQARAAGGGGRGQRGRGRVRGKGASAGRTRRCADVPGRRGRGAVCQCAVHATKCQPPCPPSAQMSPELQAAARKLAEGGDEGSLTSKVRAGNCTPPP